MWDMNGKLAKFPSTVMASHALPIFLQAKGAKPDQINALDLSIFGKPKLKYKVDGLSVEVRFSSFCRISNSHNPFLRHAVSNSTCVCIGEW